MNIQTRPTDAIVETASGKLRGAAKDGIYSFKGIRYGAPTAGARRFLPPAAPESWTGVRDALEYGPRAPQQDGAVRPANAWIRDRSPKGEDCLVLNVFTPGLGDGGKRPVMVYFHGGGYGRGSGGCRTTWRRLPIRSCSPRSFTRERRTRSMRSASVTSSITRGARCTARSPTRTCSPSAISR